MQYRVFLADRELVFSPEEHGAFLQALFGSSDEDTPIRSFNTKQGTYYFNRNHYIVSVPEEEGAGGRVVMPKTPTELKQDEERSSAARPVDLDAQLSYLNKEENE